MEIFGEEEIFCQEPSEPGEPVELFDLVFLDQVRHPSEAADAQRVKREVESSHGRAKVDLNLFAKEIISSQSLLPIVLLFSFNIAERSKS